MAFTGALSLNEAAHGLPVQHGQTAQRAGLQAAAAAGHAHAHVHTQGRVMGREPARQGLLLPERCQEWVPCRGEPGIGSPRRHVVETHWASNERRHDTR
eukprot:scaffold70765_cov37-Phaeocystis_antarctica.AAC.1